MKKITIKVEQPKARNMLAKAVRDPMGAFRPKAERDRTKYTRKTKHKANFG
jgi:hypothetical protein